MGVCVGKERKDLRKDSLSNTTSWCITGSRSKFQLEILKYYRICKQVGTGKFGVVREAYRLSNSERNDQGLDLAKAPKVAIKSTLKFRKINETEDSVKELGMLKCINHPRVLKLLEGFYDGCSVHIVTEYCEGKPLSEILAKSGPLNELQASNAVRSILEALNYLHGHNIVHRDLKLDNVMICDEDDYSDLKLIDFGFSRFFKKGENLIHKIGTPMFIAPEVLKRNYSKECDVWSLGVMTYFMLFGSGPFISSSQEMLFDEIRHFRPSFSKQKRQKISPEAIDLVSEMMTVNPSRRISVEKALKHPWISKFQERAQVPYEIWNSLVSCKKSFALVEETKKSICKYLPTFRLKKYTRAFNALDKSKKGFVSSQDLKEAGPPNEVESALLNLTGSRKGVLYFNEFLVGAFDYKQDLQDKELLAAFKSFDMDNDGLLNYEDLQSLSGVPDLELPVNFEQFKEVFYKHV